MGGSNRHLNNKIVTIVESESVVGNSLLDIVLSKEALHLGYPFFGDFFGFEIEF